LGTGHNYPPHFYRTHYWFRPSASYFLFARAKEKVTKEKARPTSGFRCAQLPSSRHCSEGRQDGPSMAQHASFGILPNAPLHSTSTRPPDGTVGPSRLDLFRTSRLRQIKNQHAFDPTSSIRARTTPLSASSPDNPRIGG
jgi:hypothetical protein